MLTLFLAIPMNYFIGIGNIGNIGIGAKWSILAIEVLVHLRGAQASCAPSRFDTCNATGGTPCQRCEIPGSCQGAVPSTPQNSEICYWLNTKECTLALQGKKVLMTLLPKSFFPCCANVHPIVPSRSCVACYVTPTCHTRI